MKIHNVRSPEQWEIISRHIDFKGKTVLDLGCGKGDILFRAFEAGATAIGIDRDADNIEYIRKTHPGIEAIRGDFSWSLPHNSMDIIICFSVLPYLLSPGVTIRWMNNYSRVALIECQYAGDGPGFSYLTDNGDMGEWLVMAGQFKKVEPIGHTLVEGRNKKRYIWMCE